MGFSLADQTIYFLFSLLFGVFLSAIYDVVRISRFLGFSKLWHIILTDILYFMICSFLTFLVSLPFNKGDVRSFFVFGEAVGFLVYRLTLGEYMTKIYRFNISVLRKFFKKTFKIVGFFSNKLLKANSFVVYNVGVIITKIQNIVLRRKRKNYEHR